MNAENTQPMVLWIPGHYTNLPEPCDLFAVPSVVTIYRVSLPVININFLHSTKHQLNKQTNRSFINVSLHHEHFVMFCQLLVNAGH